MRIWPTARRWKWMAIGLAFLIAVLLLINGALAWQKEWQLQSRLRAIRAAGHPASIAELAPQRLQDDQNAAAILERVVPQLMQFDEEHGRFYHSPLGTAYQKTRDLGEPAKPDQIEAIRAILGKHREIELALSKAAQHEAYASRMDFSLDHTAFLATLLDHLKATRIFSRYLSWRSEVLLADDRHEEAVELGIEALRLARLHENEPTMVAFLTAIAIQGIASHQVYDALSAGRIPTELHVQLDQELARHDDPQRLARALAAERAVGADWFQSHMRGAFYPLGHILAWPLKSQQVGILDVYNRYVQLAERPWYEVRTEFGPENGATAPTGHGVMADLLMPAIRASFQAHARSLAVSRSLRVYNALRRFASEHGREATGLEDLDLSRDAVTDPYTGDLLKLKLTDDGWAIYSVMDNGVDDGGDFRDARDYGVAPLRLRMSKTSGD